jgi:hypothetical protein
MMIGLDKEVSTKFSKQIITLHQHGEKYSKYRKL